MEKRRTARWKERLAARLQLPGDLAFQESVITLIGERELLVENYRGILEYTSEHLLILTRRCKIRIQGKRLEVLYYTGDEMKVSGEITDITYETLM